VKRAGLRAVVGAIALALAWPGAPRAHEAEESSSVEVAPVLSTSLPDAGGRHASVVVVTFEPGAESPPHRHPGSVLVYVLAGEVESGLDGEPAKTYRAGEGWTEHPGALHRVAKNPGNQPAKLLAVLVHDEGDALQLPPD